MNVKFMVSIWPVMQNEGSNQIEMSEKGYLLGNRATYDVWIPEARELYWQQANEGYFKHGVDCWWADCTEPFEADWKGAVKPEALCVPVGSRRASAASALASPDEVDQRL